MRFNHLIPTSTHSSTIAFLHHKWEIYAILCPAIIVDVWIASFLCYYLFRSRNEFSEYVSFNFNVCISHTSHEQIQDELRHQHLGCLCDQYRSLDCVSPLKQHVLFTFKGWILPAASQTYAFLFWWWLKFASPRYLSWNKWHSTQRQATLYISWYFILPFLNVSCNTCATVAEHHSSDTYKIFHVLS